MFRIHANIIISYVCKNAFTQDVPVRCLTERPNYYSQCVW